MQDNLHLNQVATSVSSHSTPAPAGPGAEQSCPAGQEVQGRNWDAPEGVCWPQVAHPARCVAQQPLLWPLQGGSMARMGHRARALSQNPPSTQSLAMEPPVHSNGALCQCCHPGPAEPGSASTTTAPSDEQQHPPAPPALSSPHTRSQGGAVPRGEGGPAQPVLPSPQTLLPPPDIPGWAVSSSWGVPVSWGVETLILAWLIPRGTQGHSFQLEMCGKSNPVHSQGFFLS